MGSGDTHSLTGSYHNHRSFWQRLTRGKRISPGVLRHHDLHSLQRCYRIVHNHSDRPQQNPLANWVSMGVIFER